MEEENNKIREKSQQIVLFYWNIESSLFFRNEKRERKKNEWKKKGRKEIGIERKSFQLVQASKDTNSSFEYTNLDFAEKKKKC